MRPVSEYVDKVQALDNKSLAMPRAIRGYNGNGSVYLVSLLEERKITRLPVATLPAEGFQSMLHRSYAATVRNLSSLCSWSAKLERQHNSGFRFVQTVSRRSGLRLRSSV